MSLEFTAAIYRAIRDRIRAEDPEIDEQKRQLKRLPDAACLQPPRAVARRTP